jgi:hypothetical protein
MPNDHESLPRRILYIVSAIGGWVLFVVEWVRVSHQTAHADEIIFVIVLILSLLLINGGTYAWIGHNKRIAANGKRGSTTRYASPDFSHDNLGRGLIIDRKVRESREIVISIDGDTKVYHSVEVAEGILR